jgi:hypothetical protein
MPPIRDRNLRNSVEQEGRISLAILALKNKEIRSIREAARVFVMGSREGKRHSSGDLARAGC